MDGISTVVNNNNMTQPQWFAMRATYHREVSVKSMLEEAGISCYLPMQHQIKLSHGRKMRVMKPLVSSLLFVHCDKERLQSFKSRLPQLQYMTMQTGQQRKPIIVPDRQMSDFMRVVDSHSDDLKYFSPEELCVTSGMKVRVHGGSFDGLEGRLVGARGRRNRRIVVSIDGVVSVSVEVGDAELIEVLS
ncbi:MAG: UpxY family transcription antiterminator [Muribaculaceae bacterium]|nr:UpxY family transcription antiterminator [Muribaculaceae bacterium]